MADEDDKDSKSEDPTEKKISDTLDKGNVPFSREVTNVASMLAITLVAIFYAPEFAFEIAKSLRSVFANSTDWSLGSGEEVMHLSSHLVIGISLLTLPIILPIMIAGLISSLVQNRPRLVVDRIHLKAERISLMKGLKRLFGWHTVKEFLKSIFKFTAAGIVAAIILTSQMEWIVSHLLIDSIKMPSSIHVLMVQAGLGIVLMIAVLGAVDFIWVRREWFDNIKMSHQEIKDERKQSEGDPMVKMRSQSMARDRARNKMISSVPDATLVIANPTHFSIALRYQPDIDNAPFVLAKGQDLIALKIRELAEENDIPIIEDKPLARSMYKVCVVDQEIPIEFYVPIARIVRILSEKETARS